MSVSPYKQNCRSTATALEPCGQSLSTFLRQMHPRDTAACVEAETGGRIPAGTVEKWLQLIAFPRARRQFVLMGTYGPSALAAMMPAAPRWLDEAVRRERLREMEAQSAALEAEREALTRELNGGR